MGIFIICIVAIWLIAVGILFAREIKKAPLVDERAPFLRGDYDPKNDPSIHTVEFDHAEKFCSHCKYYDGVAMCLNDNNFGQITHDLVLCCKNNSYFEVK